MKRMLALPLVALTATCASSDFSPDSGADAPNFLVLIGDDMGKETLSCFEIGESPAITPNLDRLCAQGVRFESMWTQPYCSPTRATLLTGQYSASSGQLMPVMPNIASSIEQPEKSADAHPENRILRLEVLTQALPEEIIMGSRGLRPAQITLPQVLKEHAPEYSAGAFGKWHLADHTNGGLEHPNMSGFDHFSGYMDGTIYSFFAWKHVENGEESPATGYFTTRMVDDAIAWIGEQDGPWFTWVAFTAPHEPFHLPPVDLISEETAELDPAGVGQGDDHPYFLAAIEAMDAEIGRLLSAIPDEELANTYVMFIGDNGTPVEVAQPPYTAETVKGTVYQGGIDMPFIMTGPDIEPGVYPYLANSTDVFQTVLTLAGAPSHAMTDDGFGGDSISFAQNMVSDAPAPRAWAYADGGELGIGGGVNRAVRDERYKYIDLHGTDLFFDLQADPFERDNLLERELSQDEQAALETLKARADAVRPPQPAR